MQFENECTTKTTQNYGYWHNYREPLQKKEVKKLKRNHIGTLLKLYTTRLDNGYLSLPTIKSSNKSYTTMVIIKVVNILNSLTLVRCFPRRSWKLVSVVSWVQPWLLSLGLSDLLVAIAEMRCMYSICTSALTYGNLLCSSVKYSSIKNKATCYWLL